MTPRSSEFTKHGKPQYKIFLAHDTGDRIYANALYRMLDQWFGKSIKITYSQEFSPGVDWNLLIKQALKNGDLLLALLTPRSVKNTWIHFEAGAFYGRKHKVVPVTALGLRPADLPAPLNSFTALDLMNSDDINKLANMIAEDAHLTPIKKSKRAVERFRPKPVTGLPRGEEASVSRLLKNFRLEPNLRTREVLARSHDAYPYAVDDLIAIYISPGFDGHSKNVIKSEHIGRRSYIPEVMKVAQDYRSQDPEKDNNEPKAGLTQLDPFLTDRSNLRMVFEEMHWFDFEGPRRALYTGDIPTEFANRFYLGKMIPEEIPTPLTSVHTVLVTKDDFLVVGLRRKMAKLAFYSDRLSIGFEEQMKPEDCDIFGTVKRGLQEETRITNVVDSSIQLLAIGLEASFFSIAPIALARLDCDARTLHDSIQQAESHEWDPLFVRYNVEHLMTLLRSRAPKWQDLGAEKFFEFAPLPEYEWHGTSRFRLFAYLANRIGTGRLISYV